MAPTVQDVVRFMQQFPPEKLFQTLIQEEEIFRRYLERLLLPRILSTHESTLGCAWHKVNIMGEDQGHAQSFPCPGEPRVPSLDIVQNSHMANNAVATAKSTQQQKPQSRVSLSNGESPPLSLLPIRLELHIQAQFHGWMQKPWTFWSCKSYPASDSHALPPQGKEVFRIALQISQSLDKSAQINPLRQIFLGVLFAELSGRLKCNQASKRTVKIVKNFISPKEEWTPEELEYCQSLIRTGNQCQRTGRHLMGINGDINPTRIDYGPLFFPGRDQLTAKYNTIDRLTKMMRALHRRGIMTSSQETGASALAQQLLDYMFSCIKWSPPTYGHQILASTYKGNKRIAESEQVPRKVSRIEQDTHSEQNVEYSAAMAMQSMALSSEHTNSNQTWPCGVTRYAHTRPLVDNRNVTMTCNHVNQLNKGVVPSLPPRAVREAVKSAVDIDENIVSFYHTNDISWSTSGINDVSYMIDNIYDLNTKVDDAYSTGI
ncbi:hypothetical protein CDD81_463 [Ophiocordyceps australis]|uniref:Uncharacterized protein n=1 Tax=Ophiocordyceps australis TaxID=1399860 RepID=A0A2C5X8K1_9HYPO|nr:hypothetical protein CDD81_463 [Ophiocordyceps australis]